MEDVRNKYVPPALSETAFNCPHCGALAKQFWYSSHLEPITKDNTPRFFDPEKSEELRFDHIEDTDQRQIVIRWATKMSSGRPFMDTHRQSTDYDLYNVSISKCFNCNDIAIWIYNRLVWPRQGTAPLPNPDLPKEIREDYEEASTILDLSARGAAALLRLGIQKLCKHLEETGDNINDDIAALVRKGLDPRIQQALDVVRVVGNHAVHPGQIDLKDDRATAENLFGLVNLITERMISQPKHVKSMYDKLPENVRQAIETRDGKK